VVVARATKQPACVLFVLGLLFAPPPWDALLAFKAFSASAAAFFSALAASFKAASAFTFNYEATNITDTTYKAGSTVGEGRQALALPRRSQPT
jgi:hypothetical protein